jgi:hypothetical protein
MVTTANASKWECGASKGYGVKIDRNRIGDAVIVLFSDR